MQGTVEEFQKRTADEEGQDLKATSDEEDELGIMQHFVRDFIDRSR